MQRKRLALLFIIALAISFPTVEIEKHNAKKIKIKKKKVCKNIDINKHNQKMQQYILQLKNKSMEYKIQQKLQKEEQENNKENQANSIQWIEHM